MTNLPPPGETPPASPPPPAPPAAGWWLASDGQWYPPESAPGGAAPPPPPQAFPGPAYGAPGYGYAAYPVNQGTNGMAIASLVLGIVWVYWIGSILAIVFGFVALGQLKQRPQGGRGLAIAGIVLGFVGVATLVLVVLVAAFGSSTTVRFSSVGG